MSSRVCTKCGEHLPFERFSKAATGRDGLRGDCKSCRKLSTDRWYAGLSVQKKRARAASPSKRRYMKAYVSANAEHIRAVKRDWVERNIQRHRDSTRQAMRRRRATPKGRLENNIARALHKALRGKKGGQSTFDLLGYNLADLASHLEARFLPGMSWENYGDWHVDHVIPLAAHNYETASDIDFNKAWALSNLQPLWATANITKGARLTVPFQPSLMIGEARG